MNKLDFSLFVRDFEQHKKLKKLQELTNLAGIIFLFIAVPFSFIMLLNSFGGLGALLYIATGSEAIVFLGYLGILAVQAVCLHKYRNIGTADAPSIEPIFTSVNLKFDEYAKRRNRLILSFGAAFIVIAAVTVALLLVFKNESYAVIGIILVCGIIMLFALLIVPFVMIMAAQRKIFSESEGEFKLIENYFLALEEHRNGTEV